MTDEEIEQNIAKSRALSRRYFRPALWLTAGSCLLFASLTRGGFSNTDDPAAGFLERFVLSSIFVYPIALFIVWAALSNREN